MEPKIITTTILGAICVMAISGFVVGDASAAYWWETYDFDRYPAACGSATPAETVILPKHPGDNSYHAGPIAGTDEGIFWVVAHDTALRYHQIRAFNYTDNFAPLPDRNVGLHTYGSNPERAEVTGLSEDGDDLVALDNIGHHIWYEPDGFRGEDLGIHRLTAHKSGFGGLWFDSSNDDLYVIDRELNTPQGHIRVIDVSGTNNDRVSSKDIPIGALYVFDGTFGQAGLWSDGDTIWVADMMRCKLAAYDLSSKARMPGLDVNGTVREVSGLWGDADKNLLWVVFRDSANPGPIQLYGYTMPSSGAMSPVDPTEITYRIIEGQSWSERLTGTDDLAMSGDDIPTGLTLDTSTRTVSWTPSNGQDGTYTVRITGTTNGATTSITIMTIIVSDNQRPNIILSSLDRTITAGDDFTDYGGVCWDDIDQPRQIYADSIPDLNTAGTHTLTYRCTDSFGLSAVPKFMTLTILAKESANDPETTDHSTDYDPPTTPEQDPDPEPNAGEEPTEKDPITPTNSTDTAPDPDPGVGEEPAQEDPVPPTTEEPPKEPSPPPPPANNVPVLQDIADRWVEEGRNLSFTVTATDDDPGDTLTYSASNLPDGASFDGATGKFSWTPTESQGPGSYTITFGVTDGEDAGTTRPMTITVHEVNQEPQLEHKAVEGYRCNASLDSSISTTFSVTDADLPAQTLSLSTYPSDIAYSASISNGVISFSTNIPADEESASHDGQVIFYMEIYDGYADTDLLIFMQLPSVHVSGLPSC